MKKYLLLFLILVSGFVFLTSQNPVFLEGLGLLLGILTLLWLLSLYLKDSSIIDIFWGLGFVVLAWFYHYRLGSNGTRTTLLCGLVTLWGIRLAVYIGARNWGKGEDYRYQVFRKEGGKHYWWLSYPRVFVLQGLLLWIIGSPLLMAQQTQGNLQWSDYLGIMLWLIGFGFEAISDCQLSRFKNNPANGGKVMDKGLWSLTRHPNYFGDALLWWGYFCFAWATEGGWIYFFAPLLMTLLLLFVSGVALLERTLEKSKPQYQHYAKRVPAFFPKIW